MLSFFAATALFAQAPPVTVTIDTRVHYQHGNNKDFTTGTPDLPREARDSVMMGATMHYFVMPDTAFNRAYANAGKADADNWIGGTASTKSSFAWSITPATPIGTVTPVLPNSGTSTSPHVTILWTGVSAATPVDTIVFVETPKEYKGVALPAGSVCDGNPVKIPITSIHQPNVMFGVNENSTRDTVVCAESNVGIKLNLPLAGLGAGGNYGSVISEASGVTIDYTIAKDGGTPVAETAKFPSLKTAAYRWKLPVSDYGVYEIVITKITDRIATKCNITDNNVSLTTADNTYTYVVMPKPASGPTYHIPNNF
jgi:hypothetical protein